MSTLNVNNEPEYLTVLGHPEVSEEIKVITHYVSKMPNTVKREILISFLKDNTIKIDWLTGNDLLVQMITSGSLKMYHTERLFESVPGDKTFVAGLEECIEKKLANREPDGEHKNVVTALSRVESFQDQCYYACVSKTAIDTQRLMGIHEEEVPNVSNRIESKIVNVMEKSMKAIMRTLFSLNPSMRLQCW